ncbi:diguanylate cyclase, partial [Salmonella enterica subsp. enterica serovar Infantis]
WPAILPDIY